MKYAKLFEDDVTLDNKYAIKQAGTYALELGSCLPASKQHPKRW